MGACLARGTGFDLRINRCPVLSTHGVGGKLRPLTQFLSAQRAQQSPIHRLPSRGDRDLTVCSTEQAIRRTNRMVIPCTLWQVPACQIVRCQEAKATDQTTNEADRD